MMETIFALEIPAFFFSGGDRHGQAGRLAGIFPEQIAHSMVFYCYQRFKLEITS